MPTTEIKPTVRLSDSVKSPPDVYVADDIAAKLQISRRQVWRMNDSGRMPCPFRINRLVRWSASAIDQWIADGCPPLRKGAR
jgi:predicted DNA-binding transcriptional regulator AlpA